MSYMVQSTKCTMLHMQIFSALDPAGGTMWIGFSVPARLREFSLE